jgi:peptidoglycan/xylan/chitin deacetylase (PgdA/CDA1 family)
VSIIREIVFFSVRWSGLSFLLSNALARNNVTVLLYHDPDPVVMERHLSYLSRHYRFIPLSRLVDALHARDWTTIPPKSLVITFDDGLKRNFELLQLFQRYDVIPTIYICSQIVATNRHYWFLEAQAEPLKHLRNEDRLKRLEDMIGFTREKEYSDRQALDATEIQSMSHAVDFQSHSRFHPILTTCSDAECEIEIRDSRREIEELTGQECRHFAYPNGDYTQREIDLLKKYGYMSARTIDLGWNGINTDPFRLKVLTWRDDASVNRLAADLCGISGYLGRLRRGSLTGRWRSIVLDQPEKTSDRR